jgi:hypothetical protein
VRQLVQALTGKPRRIGTGQQYAIEYPRIRQFPCDRFDFEQGIETASSPRFPARSSVSLASGLGAQDEDTPHQAPNKLRIDSGALREHLARERRGRLAVAAIEHRAMLDHLAPSSLKDLGPHPKVAVLEARRKAATAKRRSHRERG